MELPTFARYVCILILGLAVVSLYFLFSNQYDTIIHKLKIPFQKLNLSKNESIIDEQIPLNFTFESRLSSTYPYLPIHIYTQNLSLLNKKNSKLILVGNGFFGTRSWNLFEKNESSKSISNQYVLKENAAIFI